MFVFLVRTFQTLSMHFTKHVKHMIGCQMSRRRVKKDIRKKREQEEGKHKHKKDDVLQSSEKLLLLRLSWTL